MAYARCEVTVKASASEVYEFLLDGENNPLWRPGILDIKKLGHSTPIDVGTVFVQGMRGPNNTRISADYEMTECISNSRLAFKVITGPYRAEGLFEIKEAGEKTNIAFSMDEKGTLDEKRSEHLQRVVNALEGLKTYYEQINMPHMVMIGSTGRNSGKTTLAIELIKKWKMNHKIIGLKVTTIHDEKGPCPRGGEGCGVCESLKENYEILEETNPHSEKDTSLLLNAGSNRVFWLKAKRPYIEEGIRAFMAQCDPEALIICESNSLRHVVKPGMFIMLKSGEPSIKTSAKKVMHYADFLVDYQLNKKPMVLENLVVGKKDSRLSIEKIKEAI